MKITGIVVTGVGGGVGQSILKCLEGSDYPVIAVDGLADATGLYAVKRSYVGAFANSDQFIPRLLEICKKESANVIFPGLDAELIPLSKHKAFFKERGIEVVVSPEAVVEIADDKYLTAKFLEDHGFPHPRTAITLESDFKFPVIVKPRKGGARSVGVVTCRNQAELEAAVAGADNFVIQENIEGDEYTCGTLSAQGVCYGVIPMKRSLRSGDTYKAYVEKNRAVIDYLKMVIGKLKPWGPCNVQLRYKDGQCFIFEFNARCSGTTAARAMAGFNEPLWICRAIESSEYKELDFQEIAVFRYWNEMAVPISEVAELKSRGYSTEKGVRNLWSGQ
jgi:carbamoyl-phosphate synthase large subunit